MYIKTGFLLLLLFACKVERVLYVNSLENSETSECNLTQETETTISDREVSLILRSSAQKPKIRDKVNISLEGSEKGPYSWTIVQNNTALCLTSSQSREKAKVLSSGLSEGELYLSDPYRFITTTKEIDLYFQETGEYSVILEAESSFGMIDLVIKKFGDLEITEIKIINQQTSQEVDEDDGLISGRVYSFVAIFEGDDGGQEPEIRWYAYNGVRKSLLRNEDRDRTPLENNATFRIPQRTSLKIEACLADDSSCQNITKSIR